MRQTDGLRLFIFVALIVCNCAQATVLFSNGSPTLGYGIDTAIAWQADDFLLESGGSITGARFWTIEGYGIRPHAEPWDGHLSYAFLANVGGKPANQSLVQDAAASIARTDLGIQTGISGPLYAYEYTFEFAAPFVVEPNVRYFLAIHLLDHFPIGSPEIYFSTATGTLRLSPAHTGTPDFSTWYDNSQGIVGVYGAGHLAFELLDSTPEPSSLSVVVLMPAILRHRSRRFRTISTQP